MGKCNGSRQGYVGYIEEVRKKMGGMRKLMRVSEIKEVTSADEATRLMKEEGWRYLTNNTTSSPTSYILCKFTEYEPE